MRPSLFEKFSHRLMPAVTRAGLQPVPKTPSYAKRFGYLSPTKFAKSEAAEKTGRREKILGFSSSIAVHRFAHDGPYLLGISAVSQGGGECWARKDWWSGWVSNLPSGSRLLDAARLRYWNEQEIRTVAELKGACKGSLAPGSQETAVAARKGLPFAR